MHFLLSAAVSKGDLLQVLVAEDLYDRLGEAAELLRRATYKAARRWAGQEEVCRARMMSFLYDACPSARFFMQVARTHPAPLLVLKPRLSMSCPGSWRARQKLLIVKQATLGGIVAGKALHHQL